MTTATNNVSNQRQSKILERNASYTKQKFIQKSIENNGPFSGSISSQVSPYINVQLNDTLNNSNVKPVESEIDQEYKQFRSIQLKSQKGSTITQ